MRPGTANSGGWRSPQAFAGTRASTREPARSGKKKPQLITVGASVLVVGHSPATDSSMNVRKTACTYSCEPKRKV